MNVTRLSLYILCAGLWSSLSAQTEHERLIAAQADEILSLRQQIESVIRNNHTDAMEMDARIRSLKSQLANVENEYRQALAERNQAYTTVSKSRSELAYALDTERRANVLLASEIDVLKKRLKAMETGLSTEIQLTQTEQGRNQQVQRATLRRQETLIEKIAQRYDSVKQRNADLGIALAAAEGKARELEAAQQAGARQHRDEILRYQQAVSEMSIRMESGQSQQNRSESMNLHARQLIDSLKYELATLERMVDVLSQTDRVSQDRVARVERRELEVRELQERLNAQNQLIATRETQMAQREAQLAQREIQYRNLEEKEKSLKLLEARLRQQAMQSQARGD